MLTAKQRNHWSQF